MSSHYILFLLGKTTYLEKNLSAPWRCREGEKRKIYKTHAKHNSN